MLHTTDRFHSELQRSNVEELVALWLLMVCVYLFSFYLFLELFALLKGGDEIPRQVLWTKQYFGRLFLVCTMYKNVFSKRVYDVETA